MISRVPVTEQALKATCRRPSGLEGIPMVSKNVFDEDYDIFTKMGHDPYEFGMGFDAISPPQSPEAFAQSDDALACPSTQGYDECKGQVEDGNGLKPKRLVTLSATRAELQLTKIV